MTTRLSKKTGMKDTHNSDFLSLSESEAMDPLFNSEDETSADDPMRSIPTTGSDTLVQVIAQIKQQMETATDDRSTADQRWEKIVLAISSSNAADQEEHRKN